MSKRFKIVYYFLVILLTCVFSYEIFQLVEVLQEPNHKQKEFIAGDED